MKATTEFTKILARQAKKLNIDTADMTVADVAAAVAQAHVVTPTLKRNAKRRGIETKGRTFEEIMSDIQSHDTKVYGKGTLVEGPAPTKAAPDNPRLWNLKEVCAKAGVEPATARRQLRAKFGSHGKTYIFTHAEALSIIEAKSFK